MRSSLLLAAVALVLPTAAAAQSMNADVFHKRATALAKKGPMALFSRGEINALMKEGQAAGQRAREIRLATLNAGRKPRSCPPEGKQSMGTDEFMKRLSAIPQADRAKIDMTEAMIRISAQKFPCKA